MVNFDSELLAAALTVTTLDYHPWRHVAETTILRRPAGSLASLGQTSIVRAFPLPQHQLPMVTSVRGR